MLYPYTRVRESPTLRKAGKICHVAKHSHVDVVLVVVEELRVARRASDRSIFTSASSRVTVPFKLLYDMRCLACRHASLSGAEAQAPKPRQLRHGSSGRTSRAIVIPPTPLLLSVVHDVSVFYVSVFVRGRSSRRVQQGRPSFSVDIHQQRKRRQRRHTFVGLRG